MSSKFIAKDFDTAILTVDPGVYTMGACLWDESVWNSQEVAFPEHTLNIIVKDHERKGIGPNESMRTLVQHLIPWFDAYDIVACYCEKPQFFNSARGFATGIQGHLQQLEMFRGILFQWCDRYDCEFHDVPVLEWKGQLSKKITADRIKDIYVKFHHREELMKLSANKSNDWDACGIGLYAQGVFK